MTLIKREKLGQPALLAAAFLGMPALFYCFAFGRGAFALSNSLAASGLCLLSLGGLWWVKHSGFFSLAKYGCKKFAALLNPSGRYASSPYTPTVHSGLRMKKEGAVLCLGICSVLLSFLFV